MKTVDILMLGARGSGKTSLLAAMYDFMEDRECGLQLTLGDDSESRATIQKRRDELRSMPEGVFLTPQLGIENSGAWAEYQFDLGRQDEDPAVRLTFTDYPGGFIAEAGPDHERLRFLLGKSEIVIVTVNAPSLIERGGRHSSEYNMLEEISDIFREAYEEVPEPRLVLFVLMKCEKYLLDPRYKGALRRAVRSDNQYETLMTKFFGASSRAQKIAVVIAPVQTIGSVVFANVESTEDGKVEKWAFEKTHALAKYSPEDTDQPLRQIVRFLLARREDARRKQRRIFGIRLGLKRDWLGDKELRKDMRIFARRCKDDGEFEVVTSLARRLLDVNID